MDLVDLQPRLLVPGVLCQAYGDSPFRRSVDAYAADFLAIEPGGVLVLPGLNQHRVQIDYKDGSVSRFVFLHPRARQRLKPYHYMEVKFGHIAEDELKGKYIDEAQFLNYPYKLEDIFAQLVKTP